MEDHGNLPTFKIIVSEISRRESVNKKFNAQSLSVLYKLSPSFPDSRIHIAHILREIARVVKQILIDKFPSNHPSNMIQLKINHSLLTNPILTSYIKAIELTEEVIFE